MVVEAGHRNKVGARHSTRRNAHCIGERPVCGSPAEEIVRCWPITLIPSGLGSVDDTGIDCNHADQASLSRCQKLVLRPWAIRTDWMRARPRACMARRFTSGRTGRSWRRSREPLLCRERVVTSGSTPEDRTFLSKLDTRTGALSVDTRFRDVDGQVGFSFAERDWPHGWRGNGAPHGAVFTR
jgi:hypothetical protein